MEKSMTNLHLGAYTRILDNLQLNLSAGKQLAPMNRPGYSPERVQRELRAFEEMEKILNIFGREYEKLSDSEKEVYTRIYGPGKAHVHTHIGC